MNPNQEDPNNHVPKVSPGDQWDDLDSSPSSDKSQLPPRRVERSLPPKKELKRVHVTRHEARLKVDGEGEEEPSPDPLKKKAGKKARKVGKKAPKKKVIKSETIKGEKELKNDSQKKVGRAKKIEDGEAGDRGKSDEDASGTDVAKGQVPAAPDGRVSRLRVREIAPKKDAGAAIHGVSKMAPNVSNQDQKSSDEEVAKQRRRFVRGERNDWGEKKGRDSMRWMLYSGVGIVLLVVITVFLSQRNAPRTERESDKSLFGQLEPSEADQEVADESITLDFLTDSQEEAHDIYAAFVTAKSIDDFSGFLYLGDKNLPIVEEFWEPSNTKEGWRPGDSATWTVLERDGVRYGVLVGTKEDFTNFSAFFRNGESGLKLDWKASAGHCTASFHELKSGKGDGSEIRAWISSSDFYTYALPEKEYQSYRLMSPSGDHTLWAYTATEGELSQTLRNLFVPSPITGEVQSEVQVVISIERGPDESLPNQWVIKDLVRLSWLDN